jgi:hypothetical protein
MEPKKRLCIGAKAKAFMRSRSIWLVMMMKAMVNPLCRKRPPHHEGFCNAD